MLVPRGGYYIYLYIYRSNAHVCNDFSRFFSEIHRPKSSASGGDGGSCSRFRQCTVLMHRIETEQHILFICFKNIWEICIILQVSLILTSREYVIYPEWHWTNLHRRVKTKESKHLGGHAAFRLLNCFCLCLNQETKLALSTRVCSMNLFPKKGSKLSQQKSAWGLWLAMLFLKFTR